MKIYQSQDVFKTKVSVLLVAGIGCLQCVFGALDSDTVRARLVQEQQAKQKHDDDYVVAFVNLAKIVSAEKWPTSALIVTAQADVTNIVKTVVSTASVDEKAGSAGGPIRMTWYDEQLSVIHPAPAVTPTAQNRMRLDFAVYESTADAQWALLKTLGGQSHANVEVSPQGFSDAVLAEWGTERELVYHNVYIHLYAMQRQGFGAKPPKEDAQYIRSLLRKIYHELGKLPLIEAGKVRKIAQVVTKSAIPNGPADVSEIRISIGAEYADYRMDVTVRPDVATKIVKQPGELRIRGKFSGADRLYVQIRGTGPKGQVLSETVEIDPSAL